MGGHVKARVQEMARKVPKESAEPRALQITLYLTPGGGELMPQRTQAEGKVAGSTN